MYLGVTEVRRNSPPKDHSVPTAVRRCGYRRHGRASKRQFQKRVCGRREWQKSAWERTYRAVYHRAIGEERRDHLVSIPLVLLAYRYFGTRVRLRLTTARGHTRADPFYSFSLIPDEFVVLDKKPPMVWTRNAKSARDVSIDSVTADLWHDSPRPIRKAPLHSLESVARRCGSLHLRSLPFTRARTDNVSPLLRRALADLMKPQTHRNRKADKTRCAQTWTYKCLNI